MQNSYLALPLAGLAALLTPLSAGAEANEANATNATNAAKEAKGNSKADVPAIDYSHFEIDDADPAGNLPTAAEAERAALKFGHMLVDLDTRLEAARKRGDWAQAIKYDQALVRLGPERAAGYSGLCRDNELGGSRDDALQACAVAVQKHGVVVDDFARFVRLVIHRPGGIDAVELGDARNAIEHLKNEEASRVTGYQLQCELSLQQGDDVAFEECTNTLSKLAPDDPKSITFAWSLAMKKGDRARALAIVEQARKHGHMSDAVAQMERGARELASEQTDGSSLRTSFSHPMLRWLLGLLAALACGIFVARRLTRQGSSA